MNVSLSSRHTVHAANTDSNSPKCHNFGAPHGAESYRATTREVTCKKCLKALETVEAPVTETVEIVAETAAETAQDADTTDGRPYLTFVQDRPMWALPGSPMRFTSKARANAHLARAV